MALAQTPGGTQHRAARLRAAIGLMSGTSLDGVDAALLRSDGRAGVEAGPSLTVAYDPALREALRGCLGRSAAPADVVAAMTRAHADAVAVLIARHGIDRREIAAVGFHGQTILHRPDRRQTVQIGDAALLAGLTGLDVVHDFRSADVAAGGQGAPLAPVYHAARAAGLERPLAVLNLGGVGNVTWIGADFDLGAGAPADDGLLAFDTGPGNAPIDDWMRAATGQAFDADGRLAAAGRADEGRVQAALAHPYFARTPPKSLDRDDFGAAAAAGLAPADGAATLVRITALAVAAARRHFPAPPRRWLVTGGGRRNAALMRALAAALPEPVAPVEAVGWDGDALEAEAFAYLALRVLDGLPLSFPRTTGAPRPLAGGRISRASAL
jgi:anhydro-N-acetylmuramic acid kinase